MEPWTWLSFVISTARLQFHLDIQPTNSYQFNYQAGILALV